VRRLAIALVSLVALAGGVTTAVGSTAGAGHPHAKTVRPLTAAVHGRPLPPVPLALRRALNRLEHPLQALRPRTITRNAPIVPGAGGGTCYVSSPACSIHPCAQFVSPGAQALALSGAQPSVAINAPQTARTHCHRAIGPGVSEPVGGVRIAPDAGAVSIQRMSTVVSSTR
jgi:hypothetical protein